MFINWKTIYKYVKSLALCTYTHRETWTAITYWDSKTKVSFLAMENTDEEPQSLSFERMRNWSPHWKKPASSCLQSKSKDTPSSKPARRTPSRLSGGQDSTVKPQKRTQDSTLKEAGGRGGMEVCRAGRALRIIRTAPGLGGRGSPGPDPEKWQPTLRYHRLCPR